MLNLEQQAHWCNEDGSKLNDDDLAVKILDYAKTGGTIYVGADSMYNNERGCYFASVIAFHNRKPDIADYFYKTIKIKSEKYKSLKIKILEEVNLALQAANLVSAIYEDADIEVHIDIGTRKINLTRTLYDSVRGWVVSSGYRLKIKPYSWASSSIADWHTK